MKRYIIILLLAILITLIPFLLGFRDLKETMISFLSGILIFIPMGIWLGKKLEERQSKDWAWYLILWYYNYCRGLHYHNPNDTTVQSKENTIILYVIVDHSLAVCQRLIWKQLIHQYPPHGDDMANAAREDEEMEYGVHVSAPVEAVEHGAGDVTDAFGYNPDEVGRGKRVDQRFESDEHAQSHAHETTCF